MNLGLARRGYSSTGGAEAYLKRFAAALQAAGHSCTFFTTADWPRAEVPLPANQVVLPGRTPIEFANAVEPARAGCDYLFSLERVWACDAYRAGDGVHRAWLARRAQVEPCWQRWGRVFNGKHRQLLALEESLFSQQGAGTVIANSRMVQAELVKEYGYPANQVHVVYNGLPFAQPSPQLSAPTRARLGLRETDYVILFAGSGWERKGLAAAIAGVRNLPSACRPVLLVAGKGNPRQYGGNTERVRFLGPVKNLAELYAAAAVFLLPTLYDPFSNACLEALAAGLPVITSSGNGFSELLQPGVDGEVLESPTEVPAVVKALVSWSDPLRRQAIRPRLLELAGRFTIEANLRATLTALGQGNPPCQAGA